MADVEIARGQGLYDAMRRFFAGPQGEDDRMVLFATLTVLGGTMWAKEQMARFDVEVPRAPWLEADDAGALA